MDDMDKLTFGRILIDKKHLFFGKISPMVCIFADAFFTKEDGEDHEVWIDCFRGHVKIKVSELLNKERFEIIDIFLDATKDIVKQINELEAKYAE